MKTPEFTHVDRARLFFWLLIATAAGLIVFGLYALESVPKEGKTRLVTVKDVPLRVAVADTDSERTKGLSGLDQLPDGEGLLFLFDFPGIYGFWMKDMRFPIDILWFNERFELVYMKERAEPSTYPEVFTPDRSALYVLEVPAGFAEKHQIKIGDLLTF